MPVVSVAADPDGNLAEVAVIAVAATAAATAIAVVVVVAEAAMVVVVGSRVIIPTPLPDVAAHVI